MLVNSNYSGRVNYANQQMVFKGKDKNAQPHNGLLKGTIAAVTTGAAAIAANPALFAAAEKVVEAGAKAGGAPLSGITLTEVVTSALIGAGAGLLIRKIIGD